MALVDVAVVVMGEDRDFHMAVEKVQALNDMCRRYGAYDIWIQVDGELAPESAAVLIGLGASAVVAGGALFSAGDKRGVVDSLRGRA
mmetsp:Transcript_40627/g.129583  ORF Transcript_40627/g.129583 Transcript_40627/m.129583 type:complete len:87 (+) Transcript_40627:1566-1826(+)